MSEASSPTRDTLTPRQQELLIMVAEGKTNKEIAAELKLAAGTVEAHLSGLRRRLGIRRVALLVRFAIRTGLIEP